MKMFPRCYIVVKHVCLKAASPSCEKTYYTALNSVRRFCILQNLQHKTLKVNKLSFIWTQNQLSRKEGDLSKSSSKGDESKLSDKTQASNTKTEGKQTQICEMTDSAKDICVSTADSKLNLSVNNQSSKSIEVKPTSSQTDLNIKAQPDNKFSEVEQKQGPVKDATKDLTSKAMPEVQQKDKPSMVSVVASEMEEKSADDKKIKVEVKEGDSTKTLISSEPIKKLKEKIIEAIPGHAKEESKKSADTSDPASTTTTVKVPKKRVKVDYAAETFDRNFITPVRALGDFLLKPSDLEHLPKTKRRSPYENEPPMTVYWRRDVQAKSISVWGSMENLQKERLKRDIERKKYQQNIFTVKRRLRDYRREMGRGEKSQQTEPGIKGRSGKVVLTAVVINGANFLVKLCAWLYTGSHSMFSETIHSFADTINQIILAYGIHKSVQIADAYHPYGYSNMKYVASLISGVGIFCVGTGLSFYHGISGLINPEPIDDVFLAYFVLSGSLVSEGATWAVAFSSIRKGAKEAKMTVKDFVFRGQDPSVNVVLLEDFAAVVGVIAAGSCIALSTYTNSPIPDAIGSLLVGGILGCVASFIIYTNVAALVGRSIPEENLEKINAELESDIMVRAIHDVKGIDMGGYLVRYKAELDFDGRELTRAYLDKQDLSALLEEVKKVENIDEIEEFMLKHGENIVDKMGGEIDRIEYKLRKKHPEIRHCDLEIL